MGHSSLRPDHDSKHLPYFFARQDDGQTLESLGTYRSNGAIRRLREHSGIEHEPSHADLVVGGSSEAIMHRQIGKERFPFGSIHAVWMAGVMKVSGPFYPATGGVFGATGGVLPPDGLMTQITQARLGWGMMMTLLVRNISYACRSACG